MKTRGKIPKEKKPSGRSRGRSGGKKESNDSIDGRGRGTSDFPSRRPGETARDWDSWPTSPFGPNGADI